METYTKLAYPKHKPKKAGLYPTNLGELYWDKALNKGWTRNISDAFCLKGITYFFSPIEPTSLPLLGVKEVLGKDLKERDVIWYAQEWKELSITDRAGGRSVLRDMLAIEYPNDKVIVCTPISRERLVEVVRETMIDSMTMLPRVDLLESIVTALVKELGLNPTKP